MKLLAFVLCALVLACAPRRSAAPPSTATAAPRADAPSDTVWVELPSTGIRARLPEPFWITRQRQTKEDGEIEIVSAKAKKNGQEHSVSRGLRFGRRRAPDSELLSSMRRLLKEIHRERSITLGVFSGIELIGRSSSGPSWIRVYAVGDGFMLALATCNDGPLDEARARAFFDSLELSVPWSIRSFPELRVSVLLPDGGMEFGPRELDLMELPLARAVWIGGTGAHTFSVFGRPLTAEERAMKDHGLAQYTGALLSHGNPVLDQRTLDFDGTPGVELTFQSSEGTTRVRGFTTEHTLYGLEVRAHSRAALERSEVTRFFESLRWYDAR